MKELNIFFQRDIFWGVNFYCNKLHFIVIIIIIIFNNDNDNDNNNNNKMQHSP